MRNLSKKAKTIIAGAAIAGLASAGGAYAFWTTTGSGGGGATVAASNGVLVLTSGPLSGPVTPNSMTSFNIYATNAGNSALAVANDIHTVVSTTKAGCEITDFTVADVPSAVTVPPTGTGDPLFVGQGYLVFHQSALNQDLCKEAPLVFTFSTPVPAP